MIDRELHLIRYFDTSKWFNLSTIDRLHHTLTHVLLEIGVTHFEPIDWKHDVTESFRKDLFFVFLRDFSSDVPQSAQLKGTSTYVKTEETIMSDNFNLSI